MMPCIFVAFSILSFPVSATGGFISETLSPLLSKAFGELNEKNLENR
jgi:hypothetical protein